MNTEKQFLVGRDEIYKVVQYLKDQFNVCNIFAFYGPLGAGKTTLVKALLKDCNITGPITSPTFTYLNRYKNESGQTFYHFDLYRIEAIKDFLAFGFDEYLEQAHSWCFIEWPEVIAPLLKNKVCKVKIDYLEKNRDKRKVVVSCRI